MNLVFTASELSPYAKTGGLGEVLATLPPALKKRGHSVSVILPLYRQVAESLPKRTLTDIKITVPLGNTQMTAHVQEAVTNNGVKLFLVQKDEFFDRTYLYGSPLGDYTDNASRFIFFNKVVVELCKHIQPVPQIIHVHDWPVALVPAFVRNARLPFKCVFTIHNLAFQGSFWGVDFELTNLPQEYFTPQGLEFHGHLNFMKSGILLSDHVTTVSPRYAREIQTSEFGCGLENVLREHNHRLSGVLNGVDGDAWNPAKDRLIAKSFSARDLKGKTACKEELLARFKIKNTDMPVFACVSRLSTQKGFDLLAPVFEEFMKNDVVFLLHGSGDTYFEEYFQRMKKQFPKKMGVVIGFNDHLTRQMMAGADFFLMPSRFEPCGLSQIYAQRYATLPVVHAVGGLDDTVREYDAMTGAGTGIKFSPYEPVSFHKALLKALQLYQNKPHLLKIRREAMKQTLTWDASAKAYEEVYTRVLNS